MTILTATGLAKYYGGQDIFQDISLSIHAGDRIGLVGPNGEGKTTLLRILAGLEEPTAGQLEKSKNLSVGYLPQHAELDGQTSLQEAMLPAFSRLLAMGAELQGMEIQMSRPGCTPELFQRYGELQARFEMQGGYTYESQIRQVLAGLGFSEDDYRLPLAHMSGGQRTRALLARTLLEAPELLLLDEPTNHLDLAGIEWLEKYLSAWPGSMVIVAHDRRFLDRLTNAIWDLSVGRLEAYKGNYSEYISQREERMARQAEEYRAQKDMIARTEEYIQRYKAGQRAREARGRLRRLERLERLERPQESRRISLDIQTDLRSGDLVVRSRSLEVGYPGDPPHVLVRCPDLSLLRGERVAMLGPNGSGKTTLVRTIAGQLAPLRGEVTLGASVKVGYLAQAHAGLEPTRTVLDEILETRNLPLAKARNFLGRFLFSGDDIYKPIRQISGGERSRVALAKLTLEGANFLILDEPTNHLDIASQEILEHVLAGFRGTIILISHDRHFVDALATQVWLIQGRRLVTFGGTYSQYMESLAADRQGEAGASEIEGTQGDGRRGKAANEEFRQKQREERRQQREARRRAERASELEAIVADLESNLRRLERQLEAASAAGRLEEAHQLGRDYQDIQHRMEQMLEEWARLA